MTQLTETQRKNVDAFLAARPKMGYNREAVEYIAQKVGEEEGVPFCGTCGDWHEADDQHSMTDEDE